ncbi:hypothetical protein DE146DRAFT_732252 [Phaeosphaeria sp. MPI-PUGE-AT-0046c]|nr:hypothetical protein DE146DRAFT_732252 [Phaeosphaeria sp. MPI-PUGE-AT-0046c]
MAPKHHFPSEIPQSVFEEEDVFDDTISSVPMRTTTVPREVSGRFIRRLAKLAAASVKVQEERCGTFVEIIMTRNTGSPQARIELDTELKKFLTDLRSSLELISQHRNGPAFEQAKEDLMDSILMFSFLNVEHIIQSLQRVFNGNYDDYQELISRVLGITAEKGTEVDTEVGDAIIKLHQLTRSYDKSLRHLHNLIQTASSMINRVTHFQDRLKFLLRRPKFSNELYRLICTLGFPERAHQTFVRTAQTAQSFGQVEFIIRPNPPSPSRVRFTPSPRLTAIKAATSPPRSALRPSTRQSTSTAAAAPQVTASAKAISMPSFMLQTHSQPLLIDSTEAVPKQMQETPSANQGLSHASSTRNMDLYAIVRPYLTEDDQDVGIARLQPLVKQELAQLAAAVLRRNLIPVAARVWYTFGFVVVNGIEEERHLAGLYATILEEATDKESVFQEMMHAVETNQLPQFFDRKDYSHFRQAFPRLESFLSTSPARRPTIWLLKHFLYNTDNTVPSAVLQRDYGFRYCRQRQEVSRLKNIYTAVLKEADIMDLHSACVYGRLVEFAAQKGIFVDPKDKRLMQNDFPAPFIGYDNGLGLGAYKGPFFKRGS